MAAVLAPNVGAKAKRTPLTCPLLYPVRLVNPSQTAEAGTVERMPRVMLAAVVAFVAFATISVSNQPQAAVASAAAIDWQVCGGSFQCATLKVPVDYANPGGKTLDLALLKRPAGDPSKRIGTLMANPGGPGASAIDFARVWSSLLSKDVRDRFDIVTFDPRGVGQSSPIVCHDDLQKLIALDPTPDNAAEWDGVKAESKTFADACTKKYGDLLSALGTKNVARDMDAIRLALGEDKLNYVGYSYGTVIGSVYADMYPSRIRAWVLDGAVDLSLGFEETIGTQSVGFERALAAYEADCDQKKCAAAPNGNTAKVIDDLLAKVDQQPLPAPSADRVAGPGEVLLGIIEAMYSKFSWSGLTSALAQANKGDGSAMVKLADQYLQRDSDGSYPNLIEANSAVNYVDESCSRNPDDYIAMADRLAKLAPHFGASAASSGMTCAYWGAKADPLTVPRASGAPPIVVIGTTNDPATPFEWAVALSKQLESGVLVTHRGEGHTIYAQGDSCIDAAVNAYLLELKAPQAGLSCGNGAPPPETAPSQAPRETPVPSSSGGANDAPPTPAAAAPGPPNTGQGRDDGSLAIVLVALSVVLVAAAVAGGVVFVQRR